MANLLSSWGNLIYMFLMISPYLRLSGSESQRGVASHKQGSSSQEQEDLLQSQLHREDALWPVCLEAKALSKFLQLLKKNPATCLQLQKQMQDLLSGNCLWPGHKI